ncbi:MAG: NF038122 family metalloprotease [Cyanobacteria bacterium P01_A01_bin.135]
MQTQWLKATVVLLGAAAGCGYSLQAEAIEFNFGFAEGTSEDVVNAFNEAGDLWSSVLTDDITVNLDVEFGALNTPSLGRFTPTRVNVDYGDLVSALEADATSTNDSTAVQNLPHTSDFDLLLDPELSLLINGTQNNPNGAGSLTPYLDADGDCNNSSVRITQANAKALGLPTGGTQNCAPSSFNASSTTSDGTLQLNSLFPWDFDRSDGVDENAFDFVGVAAQGIGTALGFVSGVDVLDFNAPLILDQQEFFFNDSQFPYVSTIDLFRFSDDSVEAAELTQSSSVIDWTTGRLVDGQEVDKYFSIDGGQTKIASFSTGVMTGDGQRASSWKADELGGETIGILEPTPALGQQLDISTTDLLLFDVIGYDVVTEPPAKGSGGSTGNGSGNGSGGLPEEPVPVPEPTSGLLVGLGFAIALKYRKKQK